MAIDIDDPGRLKKATVIGGDGRKLGTVAAVYYDNDTDQPEWVAVRTGLFGLDVSVVPLAAAHLRGEELHVPFDRERLRTAPHHGQGRELTPQDERDLFAHYGLPYGARDTAAPGTGPSAERAGPADTGAAVTRSEERLRVRTESHAVERVRLRKHVVTEYEQITVPVRREEIRLEQEPVGGAGADVDSAVDPAVGSVAGSAGGAGVPVGDGEEHEIVLYAERPVVRTESVPVERVRMGKRTVTEQQQVAGQVREERVELDTDPDPDPDHDHDPGIRPGGHDPR
jgi:uncharacterized protein (TIGR02271 family)